MKNILENKFRTFIFSVIIIFINQIQAQDFEFIVQHEGEASAIGYYGNYTYFGSGGNINILETGANNQFNLINRFHTNNRNIDDITIDSNNMFVSTPSGVFIYDLTDPIHPDLMGIAEPTYSSPKGVIIFDTILIAKYEEATILFNIANPYQPEYLSSMGYDFNQNYAYALNGNILYGFMQSGFSGSQYLIGYDISDLENPVPFVYLQVSPNCGGAWPYDMAAKDNYLFVGFNDILKIYDVSTSDTIVYLTQFPVANEIRRLQLDDNNIYIAAKGTGILIYDISDIFTPELLGTYNQPEFITDFKVNNDYLLCALSNYGIAVADKTNMQNIQDVYEYLETDAVYTVHIKNNLAYFGMKESGLQIVDISNVQEPVDYGNIESLSKIWNIESIPEYLYCAEQYDSLIHIVNISDHNNPQKVAEIPVVHGWVTDYCIDQNRLFLLDSSAYIELYDLSIPGSPILVSTFQENGKCLAVKDSLLVLSEIFGEYPMEVKLKLLIIEDDNSLTHSDEIVLGEFSLYDVRKIEIDYPYVYVCSRSGLIVLMIDDNDYLTVCDELIWTEGYSYLEDMAFDSNYIYISGSFSNQGFVNIIDKTNPYELTILQSVSNYFKKLAVSNSYFYGTIANYGYYVYENDITGLDYTESKEDEFNITCNPNPCNNSTTIYFTTPNNSKSKLEIFSISGHRIYETDITNKNSMVIETESFTSGIYLCKISTNKKYSTQKLIVKE